MLRLCADQYGTITNMAMSLAASGRKKDIEKAIELADLNMALIMHYAVPDKVTYFHKLRVIMMILKAWWLSCLRELEAMEACVREAWELANLYDQSASTNELSTSIRFYFSEEKAYSYDSTGADAVAGVESMFKDDGSIVTKKNAKYMADVIKVWEQQKRAR